MGRTNFDEVFDGRGNRLSSVQRLVSDRDDLADGSSLRLQQSYAGLRQWALDAQTAYDDWPNKTNLQKDAAQREVIRRLGIFFDRFADLLLFSESDR